MKEKLEGNLLEVEVQDEVKEELRNCIKGLNDSVNEEVQQFTDIEKLNNDIEKTMQSVLEVGNQLGSVLES